MGSWDKKDNDKGAAVEWVVPHLHEDKPGETTGEQDRLHNPGFQCGEIKPQTSD